MIGDYTIIRKEHNIEISWKTYLQLGHTKYEKPKGSKYC